MNIEWKTMSEQNELIELEVIDEGVNVLVAKDKDDIVYLIKKK